MIFGDLTSSDADASPAEIRLTDLLHVLAPPAAMIGGWSALALYLAAFTVLQIVQLRRSSPRVVADTLADVAITAAAATGAVAAFGLDWPPFIFSGWLAAAGALSVYAVVQRMRT